MVEIAVLHPRDHFNNLLSKNNHQKPLHNRRRRSPTPRHQSLTSTNNDVKILKRGEDLTVEKPTRQIGSDPIQIPRRKPTTPMFYAGSATSTSPPPSDVPFPAFFAKRSVSDATIDLNRILGLDRA